MGIKIYGGRDLIEMGFMPDKWFGEALREISKTKITQEEEVFNIAKKYLQREEKKHSIVNDKKLSIYLPTSTKQEEENYEKVMASVDNILNHPKVSEVTVLPDACPAGDAYTIPVGTVASVYNSIIPEMHSADIACSVMITRLSGYEDDRDPEATLKNLLVELEDISCFGRGKTNPLFEDKVVNEDLIEEMSHNMFLRDLIPYAKYDLGTQGDGNHFISVGLCSEQDGPCIITHFGSRRLGASLYKSGRAYARKLSGLKRNAYIPLNSVEGKEYLKALNLVYDWTYDNHWVIHQMAADRLNLSITSHSFCSHNFVFQDSENNEILHHAKGATPLFDTRNALETELRAIPTNMVDPILVVKQKEDKSDTNLKFAPHGAGRLQSRTKFLKDNEGKLEKLAKEELNNFKYIPALGKPDYSELPSAYKDFGYIYSELVKMVDVEELIYPIGTIMAGREEQARF